MWTANFFHFVTFLSPFVSLLLTAFFSSCCSASIFFFFWGVCFHTYIHVSFVFHSFFFLSFSSASCYVVLLLTFFFALVSFPVSLLSLTRQEAEGRKERSNLDLKALRANLDFGDTVESHLNDRLLYSVLLFPL